MRDAEGVPEDDVGVVNVLVGGVGDPLRETLGRLAACLGDVPAGGVNLVVGV